jgi:Amt family ammonium transporter
VNALLKRMILPMILGIWPAIGWSQAIDTGDTAWMLTSTALVLFMTLPGLALFYAGLVGSRNVLSVIMQCFSIACLVSVIWVICGYSLAFGGSVGGYVGDLSRAWLSGVELDTVSGTIPESVFVMFQLTFAIITPALFVGAFAERMRFSALLLFSGAWVLVVYFPVAHWVWGGGWLGAMGFRDFAGGAVVHVTAGVAAIIAAVVMGNRKGFPNSGAPHNLPMTVTGACMLWVGWFGFNAGSAVASNGAAGMAMLVTHISAAVASLVWMTLEWVKYGKPSVLGIVTGMVAGLATITPASGYVGPMGGFFIGLAAGLGCFVATQFIKQRLKIDDSLDVFPVHGVGGMIGLLLLAIFSAERFDGLGLDGTILDQLGIQIIGLLAVIVWTAIASFVLLKVVNAISPLRVSDDEETEGLDLVSHEERGYNL